jgi:hypothetical protein
VVRRLGEILARSPVGTVVEWTDGKDWWQTAVGEDAALWWKADRWTTLRGIDVDDLRCAARVVPNSICNQGPATRGPIVATETRTGRARAILDRAIADLAEIGVECQASAHRETEVGGAMAGAVVVSLCLSATVYAADEVIP